MVKDEKLLLFRAKVLFEIMLRQVFLHIWTKKPPHSTRLLSWFLILQRSYHFYGNMLGSWKVSPVTTKDFLISPVFANLFWVYLQGKLMVVLVKVTAKRRPGSSIRLDLGLALRGCLNLKRRV